MVNFLINRKINRGIHRVAKFILLFCFLVLAQWGNAQNKVNGKKIYETRCLVCHQSDGGGVPNMNPPLDGASNVNGKDIARLVKIIRNGYDERIALDGMYYNNAMTANPDLKEEAIADVLTYIRTSWSNKASVVTTNQVKAALLKNKAAKK
jgi:mono/diheme cytochrome c family protein